MTELALIGLGWVCVMLVTQILRWGFPRRGAQ